MYCRGCVAVRQGRAFGFVEFYRLKCGTMRKITISLALGFAICACVLASCEVFHSKKIVQEPIPAESKTLQRAVLPPDSVVIDVLVARIPYQERDLATDFWNDVDELEIDPEKRKQLNEQGFRVGLVGASPPVSLSKLLTLKGRELRASLEEETDYSKPENTSEPITSSKPITLRAGMKSMIETRDDVWPSIPILENENGSLVGKSYSDARTTLSVGIVQNPDGSVRFDLAPLLKYGAPRPITRYQHGQLVRTQEQPTKNFDQLKFSVALRPGQFLVLGAADADTNALGKYFFTDSGVDFDQKILVLRLLVTQRDGQFDRFPDFKTLTARAMGEEEQDDENLNVDLEGLDGGEGNEQGGFGDYLLENDEASKDETPAEKSADGNSEHSLDVEDFLTQSESSDEDLASELSDSEK